MSESFYNIRAAADREAEILLYGEIGETWWGDGTGAKQFAEDLKAMGEIDHITLRINSPGGAVFDGFAIYNTLRAHKARITAHVDGLAASIASVIAMAADRIVMPENAMMMVHDPSGIVLGTAEDMRAAADVLDKIKHGIVAAYRTKTGMAEKDIWDLVSDETWMTASEAVEWGFADELVEPVKAAANARGFDLSRFRQPPAALQAAFQPRQAGPAGNSATPRAGAAQQKEELTMGDNTHTPSGGAAAPSNQADPAVLEKARKEAAAAEKRRQKEIRDAVSLAGLDDSLAAELIDADVSAEEAKRRCWDKMAERMNQHPTNGHHVDAGLDAKDKWMAGAEQWILVRAGLSSLFPDRRLEPGEFRGMTMSEIARASLEMQGVRTKGVGRTEMVGMALTFRNAITQSGSDFAVLLENTMHKVLQAAYARTPDTWSRFCGRGSVSDFRPHNRYRLGSFSSLDALNENGEFKMKAIPDGEKSTITADTKGNRINLSRQAIINDDLDAFSGLGTRLGRAARLSVEEDVYGLLGENSGLGPTQSDSQPLFHSNRANVGTASALSVEGLEADRVVLASQKDPAGNEYLDLRPAVLLVPIGLGGTARVINDAQYDPDTSGKLQRPNMVRGLFRDVVDTPRLSGTRRYLFADPMDAPVIEVAFLDGVDTPFLDLKDGWSVDGVEWKVRLDYGVAFVDFRGAMTNAGTS